MVSWNNKVDEICKMFNVKKEEKFKLTCVSIDNFQTKEELYCFSDSGLKSENKKHCKNEMYLLLFGDLILNKIEGSGK